MDATVLIGYLAGTFTTVSFLPQVIRSYTTRSTHDISFKMLLLFGAGMLLWTIYGILVNSMPIIAANVITFALVVVLMAMKVKYN
ncbi:MAG: SemiSWEET transporter [Methanoregula sp.]|jgi:MtN3 and saliva related transmembrane protein|nr:SemiSWEET transporter [Methanoregula sp.]